MTFCLEVLLSMQRISNSRPQLFVKVTACYFQGVICGYCTAGFQHTEAGCKPCNRGGGGGIQPVGFVMLGVAGVALVVATAVAAYWYIFGLAFQ